MKERARTIWMGNGFGIEFVVVDPFCINILLLMPKDPTLSDPANRTLGATSVYRSVERGEEDEVIPGSEESMRAFAERARLEGLEWAEAEVAEFKLSEELFTVMGEVLDSSE